jgi:hypothetical protein
MGVREGVSHASNFRQWGETMENKIKAITIIAALAIINAAVAGCSSGSSDQTPTTTAQAAGTALSPSAKAAMLASEQKYFAQQQAAVKNVTPPAPGPSKSGQ